MRRPTLIAAFAAALLIAPPAFAQGQAQLGPPLQHEPPRQPPQRTPVSFSYSEQEGTIRKGLVGEWSLSESASAGVGLYSVTDDSRRSPETRRTWTGMEVGRRTERVAAVGLKLRF